MISQFVKVELCEPSVCLLRVKPSTLFPSGSRQVFAVDCANSDIPRLSTVTHPHCSY